MIGRKLQHYSIVEKIGEGGMGEVYLAQDEKLERKVALKILPEEMAEQEDRLRRFQREARTIAALNHPNIVTVHAVEEVEEVHFLAMELIEGSALDDLIPSDGMRLEDFFRYSVPIVEALAAAHDRGITHRDIKPSNVMVTESGHVKVLDFGLAKLDSSVGSNIEASTQTLTEEGSIIGTVPYMAPEQFTGRSLDARTDLFSLGILFHQMLTGTRPFSGDSSAELISSILRDKPEPVSEIKSELPNHLGRIVRRCLEKDPDRRYQTALDLRNEIQDLKSEVDSGVLQMPASALEDRESSSSSSIPRWWLPAGLAALFALALLAFFGLRGGGATTDEPEPVPETLTTTIAVLPLEELGDSAMPGFSQLLTDEVANRLTSLPDVRVVSQSTVEQSAEGAATVKEIGELVGADYVLEGSLFWSQVEEDVTVLRFTERFIRVEDDIQVLFHDQLSEFKNPLRLQSTLAVDVAELFGGELLDLPPRELATLFPPPPPEEAESEEEPEQPPVRRAARRSAPPPKAEPAPEEAPTETDEEPAATPDLEIAVLEEPVPVQAAPGVSVSVDFETPLDDGILTIYAAESTVFRRAFKPRRKAEAEALPTAFELPAEPVQLRIYAAPAGKPARLDRLDVDLESGASTTLQIRVTRRGEVRAELRP
ncbi:MAG: serine/threonine-protein kinase [Acidobacteriota bacterium]